jgi:hypothetical protein
MEQRNTNLLLLQRALDRQGLVCCRLTKRDEKARKEDENSERHTLLLTDALLPQPYQRKNRFKREGDKKRSAKKSQTARNQRQRSKQ